MGELAGPVVAAAAAGAGFTGDQLVTIVAIGKRESGWNDTIQGDLSLMGGQWGPSVGVWQIRTLVGETGTGGDRDLQALIPGAVAGHQGSGAGDVRRQAAAAWAISGSGAGNFQPWSTYRGLNEGDLAAAREAVAGSGGSSTGGAESGGGGGFVEGLLGAVDDGLGDAVGADGSFSDWLKEMLVRGVELVGGAVILAAGVVMYLNILSTGAIARAAVPAIGLGGQAARAGGRLVRGAVRR